MTGMEVAMRTLQFETVAEPCILASRIMDVRFFESVTGQNFASDPVEVVCEAYRRVGANLCAQLTLPTGRTDADASRLGTHRHIARSWYSPEDVRDAIEDLPDTSEVSRDFDLESTRDAYARSIVELRDITGDDMLWFAGFG